MDKYKKQLSMFTSETLDMVEEMILSLPQEKIVPMIQEVRNERAKAKEQNWNSSISVEDIGLDWETISKLKGQNINTLYDVMQLDIKTIPGLYQSEVERLEWAVLFFDMTTLQREHKKNPNMSQMDVAKSIIKQSEQTDKIMAKKYGERYQGK